MRKFYMIALALGLSACATINNPITLNQLGALESGYGVALSAAVAYRHLPLCRTGTSASLQNVCAQRSVIVKLQIADRNAESAIVQANLFVRNNPTLDASTIIAAAQSALIAFQSLESSYGIRTLTP